MNFLFSVLVLVETRLASVVVPDVRPSSALASTYWFRHSVTLLPPLPAEEYVYEDEATVGDRSKYPIGRVAYSQPQPGQGSSFQTVITGSVINYYCRRAYMHLRRHGIIRPSHHHHSYPYPTNVPSKSVSTSTGYKENLIAKR